jgi:hypothetical protein
VTKDIADRLLESLRPTRHLLTRTLADIPLGGPEYREIDGLAKILIGDMVGVDQPQQPDSIDASCHDQFLAQAACQSPIRCATEANA